MKKIFGLFLVFFVLTSCVAIKRPPLPTITLNKDFSSQMKNSKSYWIEVQVPQRRLLLAKGDHIIRIFPIAVGQPEFPSPNGLRQITRVIWNPWWVPPPSKWVEDSTPVQPRSDNNPLGEIKMPLGNYYLIHGTKAVNSIGQWASHGCVRMLFEDIFALVQLLMTENSKISAVDAMEKANMDKSKEFVTALTKDISVYFTYDTVKVRNNYVTVYPDFYNREKNRVQMIASEITPYLKDGKKASSKRIQGALKAYKDQTMNVPVDSLAE